MPQNGSKLREIIGTLELNTAIVSLGDFDWIFYHSAPAGVLKKIQTTSRRLYKINIPLPLFQSHQAGTCVI